MKTVMDISYCKVWLWQKLLHENKTTVMRCDGLQRAHNIILCFISALLNASPLSLSQVSPPPQASVSHAEC